MLSLSRSLDAATSTRLRIPGRSCQENSKEARDALVRVGNCFRENTDLPQDRSSTAYIFLCVAITAVQGLC
ncbi:hypothetical protein PFLUV_G00175860 [Perca fluviatilis]|uniref:Uncharacterized protein n=1 Tax=Perca fluviatilis TaxID=8168 RepID=A0A6A5EM13_PERFL|nr:hypothetical protein PFLUV_G00175860 [Perca fluviatilis]